MKIKLDIEWEATADEGETNEDEKLASRIVSDALHAVMENRRRDCEAAGLRVHVELQPPD